jgi:hypothetical protein
MYGSPKGKIKDLLSIAYVDIVVLVLINVIGQITRDALISNVNNTQN